MRHARVTFLLAGLTVSLPAVQAPPAAIEYRGVLDRELVANTMPMYALSRLASATADARARVAGPLGESDQVYTVAMVPVAKTEYRVALVERSGGAFTLFVDLNQDGKWAEDEARSFGPSTDPNPSMPDLMETSFSVPLAGPSFYSAFPVTMQIRRESEPRGPGAAPLLLLQSSGAAIRGVVEIAGRKVRVLYTRIDLKTGAVDPMSRTVGVDCNGDGTIDMIWYSPEQMSPGGRPAVFRIGQHYVSTSRVDAASRTIVMQSHPASDYDVIELAVGAEVPDFAFVDFEGKSRYLAYTIPLCWSPETGLDHDLCQYCCCVQAGAVAAWVPH
ncbi:MAG: hypothetical protein IMZ67_09550 [Acidobacteria bacterium]|nr:hypothetical protein [Acidobacteriota bacterium]